ncbi:AAA family ATPase [Bradyrhizobium iriomotense]|uniref:AAA family ATPase n=1 Tax=Bradyrhizobium iriomotense TaxID=441950 RepID=UPI0024E187F2|nr:AAA family ATPase [Bradyrhizobium iriomotense]
MRDLFLERFGAQWQTITADSIKTLQQKSDQNREVASNLTHGQPVVGFAVERDGLPSSLTVAADLTIRVHPPRGATIRRAIRMFTGCWAPASIDENIAVGLEFDDLVAAFRTDSSPAEIIVRIRKACAAVSGSPSTERLPRLEDAIEYGAARTWGLALARDFADYREGRIEWQDIDRGAVLHSEPGLGKSLFARILAKACGVPLVAFSVADLFASSPGYLDSVIKASRAMFQRASAVAPCILFLDEIDALPNRATMSPRGADWWTPVVTDFLLSLDNAVAGTRAGIVVCAATNNINGVDAALLRPGRLERAIEITRPNHAGAVNIIRYHLNGDLANADLTDVGHLLDGCTGAEIMMAVRGARRIARHAKRNLELDDLVRAITPDEEIAPAALNRICTHEAGHAVASVVVSSGDLKRCIIGRTLTESAGRTLIANEMNGDLMTRDTVERRVVVLFAGRTAERILIGDASVGAGGYDDSDLAQATQLVAALHASAGLGDTLTYMVSLRDALTAVRTDAELRSRVEQHLRVLQTRAENLVRQHREEILAVVARLRTRRQLSGEEIRQLLKRELSHEYSTSSHN